jgi:hypothetical protein
MRERRARAGFLAAAVSLVGLAALGCTATGWQRIVGPDGSPMAHVRCGADQGTCFRLAGELCPSGYHLQPALAGHDGNFLVRCRAPKAVVVPTVTCSGNAPQVIATYPWPSPTASAVRREPPTTQPTTQAPLEIDLGY